MELALPLRVAYLPLDDRPPNLRLVQGLARAARVSLILPPPEAIPTLETPSSVLALESFLLELEEISHLVLSLDNLAFGGLTFSRRATPRGGLPGLIEALKGFKLKNPQAEILAFTVLPPTPREDQPTLLRALYQTGRGMLASGRPTPPRLRPSLRTRLLRRQRYLNTISSLLEEILPLCRAVVVGHDDVGLPMAAVAARRWLISRLPSTWREKVFLMDGADELGALTFARALIPQLTETRLPLIIAYPEGLHLRGKFESVSLARVLYEKLRFLGLEAYAIKRLTGAEIPFAIFNWPQGRQPDHLDPPLGEERQVLTNLREQLRKRYLRLLEGLTQAPRWMAADLAWANGSSPELWAQFAATPRLSFPLGYAGLNTQANALGAVLAQWVVAHYPGCRTDQLFRLSLERVADDFYYQVQFRPRVRERLRDRGMNPDLPHPEWPGWEELARELEAGVGRLLDRLSHTGRLPLTRERLTVRARFPWWRSFEAEIEIGLSE